MIDAELHAFLAAWAREWSSAPPSPTPAQRRAHFEQVALRMRAPTPVGVRCDEEHHIAVAESNSTVRVRVFRPDASGSLPALIYMHGGAWMIGSPETHWDIAAGLAADCGIAVISVDYALAPERPFPAALNDCRAVLRWAFDNAATLGLQPNAIAVGGDSAGGNLAAALTLAFRGTPYAPRAQLLVYPAVDFTLDRPSHRENADGPIVTLASMPAVNAAYCPKPQDLLDPLAAPLRAATHAGLPPAYIAVAGHDPLRDEGIAYAQVLQAAGVPVVLDHAPSMIHGYLRAMAYSHVARERFSAMGKWLREALAAPV